MPSMWPSVVVNGGSSVHRRNGEKLYMEENDPHPTLRAVHHQKTRRTSRGYGLTPSIHLCQNDTQSLRTIPHAEPLVDDGEAWRGIWGGGFMRKPCAERLL